MSFSKECNLEIEYSTTTIQKQCSDVKSAKKLFGGNDSLVRSLFSRINALENAESLQDIIVQPSFRFHKLGNKHGRNLEGYFALDVKSIREPWRIIIEPLNEEKQKYVPCDIDKIAKIVRIVEIKEVSNHYE